MNAGVRRSNSLTIGSCSFERMGHARRAWVSRRSPPARPNAWVVPSVGGSAAPHTSRGSMGAHRFTVCMVDPPGALATGPVADTRVGPARRGVVARGVAAARGDGGGPRSPRVTLLSARHARRRAWFVRSGPGRPSPSPISARRATPLATAARSATPRSRTITTSNLRWSRRGAIVRASCC